MGNKIIERQGHAINVNHVSMVGPVRQIGAAMNYVIFIGTKYAIEVSFPTHELVGECYDSMPQDALMAACEALATASRATLIDAMSNADA